jgi:hypothetical protein
VKFQTGVPVGALVLETPTIVAVYVMICPIVPYDWTPSTVNDGVAFATFIGKAEEFPGWRY